MGETLMYKGILAFAAIFATAFSAIGGNGSDTRWETFELYGEKLENSRAFVELNETEGRITGNTRSVIYGRCVSVGFCVRA
ncbi:hypothetical protein [Leptolyngbya sp. 7M]|uniref:hypothetical protein n=1 Tax=Leptolyngbya sp. 7M TaxID=2812896 RepID=UPI001B8B8D2A|nr:hypothetical protein [Leptolyngbya sp. 7M]QYO61969.1 hypothetical protein JVX88_17730 [Leptolyngbya sp. 7M]